MFPVFHLHNEALSPLTTDFQFEGGKNEGRKVECRGRLYHVAYFKLWPFK